MSKTKDIIFDIEVYPNIFSAVFYAPEIEKTLVFEVSERRNDFAMFCALVRLAGKRGARMVGFNNVGYDYPVIHALLNFQENHPAPHWSQVVAIARKKSGDIIDAPHDQRFANIIWDRDQVCQQLDLFKIHHFDNISRSTSLKVLEFNMRSENIQELPFDPTQPVAVADIPRLLSYNHHDVMETFKFYKITLPQIKLREDLATRYGRNFLNSNDTKIGKTIFQSQLEHSAGQNICYKQTPSGRKPRQTHRKEIVVKDIIFPCVKFERPEFTAVHDWMKRQTFAGSETKSVFTGLDPDGMGSLAEFSDLKTSKKADWGPVPMVRTLNCNVDGFHFVFGTGGLHGCISPGIVEADEEFAIIDIDVTSYYPTLAIENEVFPAHLGIIFCKIYKLLFEQRQKHGKGTPENAALKLALNGVYGDSNNIYSPFYDPQYTMTITLNGQLLLCLLAERLMEIKSLEMIQANTDGVTVKVHRGLLHEVDAVCAEWEKLTSLNLEQVDYSRMFVRDVNNYIGEYEDGSLKRKGAYEYEIGWHQNHSALVIQKAAEAHLIHHEPVRDFIESHFEVDPFDFYLRAKVPRSSQLWLRDDHGVVEEQIQNVSRYFISNSGQHLVKIMPPLPKNPEKVREISVQKGWSVTVHNQTAPIKDINFDYYEQEAMKLITPLIK